MKSSTRSAAEIFGYQLRYVVPMFQRPYVWNRGDQWEPLWEDVRVLAERLLDAPPNPFGHDATPPHFLGAIVVEPQPGTIGYIPAWHVVDGQQRLTTLQLLLDAVQEVVERYGNESDAKALHVLVVNESVIAAHPDERFKVWPTDHDQDAFRAAMDNATVVPPALRSAAIAQAHAYFVTQATEWATTEDEATTRRRLTALVHALRDHFKVVVIELEPGDNAQVIFETLNHRGMALLAADLVKNLVFQLARTQQRDVAALYTEHWRPLDGEQWRTKIAQGRLFRPRIDVFLNYWLTMKLRAEVANDRVYAEFRDRIARPETPADGLVAEIAGDARVYAEIERLPADSPDGTFYYRVVRASDTGAVTPVLLWLRRQSEADLPTDERIRALRAIESWVIRRTLSRLTAKNVNLVVLDLLRTLDSGDSCDAGARTEQFLAGQSADSRLWPDDDTVRASLRNLPAYTALLRPRLRMVLEALEDDLRSSGYGEGQRCPRELTVEHVMPREWHEHWPVAADADPVARGAAIHRLGNLTLVTGKHNSVLSNRAWRAPDSKGKYDYLLANSQLKLNADIVAAHEHAWTEADIDARTDALIDRILALWPRPAGAPATRPDASAFEATPPADEIPHSGKYAALTAWLRDQIRDEITMSFDDVEDILGMPLPPSSRMYQPHWHSQDGSAVARAIHAAGWKATRVNLLDERVTFIRN